MVLNEHESTRPYRTVVHFVPYYPTRTFRSVQAHPYVLPSRITYYGEYGTVRVVLMHLTATVRPVFVTKWQETHAVAYCRTESSTVRALIRYECRSLRITSRIRRRPANIGYLSYPYRAVLSLDMAGSILNERRKQTRWRHCSVEAHRLQHRSLHRFVAVEFVGAEVEPLELRQMLFGAGSYD